MDTRRCLESSLRRGLEHRGQTGTGDGKVNIMEQAHEMKSGEQMRSVSGHREGQEGDNTCHVLIFLFISSGLSPVQAWINSYERGIFIDTLSIIYPDFIEKDHEFGKVMWLPKDVIV